MKVITSPGSNPFCVPAALSCITGLHVDEICRLIQEKLGDQLITGLFYPLALEILEDLGYSFERVKLKDKYIENSVCFLIFHRHVGVYHKGIFYDNGYPEGVHCLPKAQPEAIYRVWKR